MAIPVISTTTSILGYRKGQYFEYQMAATNAPTSWAAPGLPDGMTISSAGLISGTASAPGVYLIHVTATNVDGPSAVLEVAMGIEDTNFNDGIGIEMNIDLRSGAVSVPGITPSSGLNASPATMFLKHNDKVFLDVGFLKGEELQTMDMTSIKMNIREFDGETILVESDGLIQVIGTSDRPRYRIFVDLETAELLNALGNYQGDFGTTFNAIAEIEWVADYTEPGALAPSTPRPFSTPPIRTRFTEPAPSFPCMRTSAPLPPDERWTWNDLAACG